MMNHKLTKKGQKAKFYIQHQKKTQCTLSLVFIGSLSFTNMKSRGLINQSTFSSPT